MFDMKAFADATASIVQTHVERATASLLKRIEELEGRQPDKGEKGDPGEPGASGRDADMDSITEMVRAAVDEAVSALPPAPAGPQGEPGEDGKDIDPDAVKQMVEEAVATLPAPRDGIDGKDGETIDPEEVRSMVGDEVAKAVAAIPVPKDGADGKDGAGIVEAHVDRSGELILTFSDGRTKSVGAIVGKDGTDGVDGERGPAGFSLEHFDVKHSEDGRTITLSFEQGDVREEYELEFPVVIDRGVWKPGEFKAGDAVTWGGSLWIAQRDTSSKPDDPNTGWRLAVRKGRDGKDAGGR